MSLSFPLLPVLKTKIVSMNKCPEKQNCPELRTTEDLS
jgi:hypothetical protein